ncbi:MAG TPA: peptidylprolyl isomerase [Thermoanaerobaculia bacterium]|jgi:peptidyl-prolyl cis-trans isomerase C|nr:peptidylprolyl isomerase [Thermoanaerobaculia bacterium]
MTRSSTSRTQILALSLAFLLTGLTACSKGSGGEEQTPAPDANVSDTATPAQPGQAASPAAPGEMGALPGQPPTAPVPPAPPADTSKMPAVVARCNGVEIKKDELVRQAEQMRMRVMQASRGQQTPPLNSAFYKQILDGLVAQTLLLQDASKQGVTVSDQEVKTQLDDLKKRFPDAATFQKALASQGMTEKALSDNLRQEALIQKYITTKVLNNVNVTDEQARQFYEQNKGQMQRPERAHLRHILIGVQPNASADDKQKAKAKAEDILKRAQGGEDFAKLAAENSDDPGSKMQGGDLSWVLRGQMVPPFDKAGFALTKPNELSPVVESQFGYHIIQLLERQPASAVPFEEAKGRIVQMLKQQQAGQKLQAHVEQLKKQGKVEVFM